MPDFSKPRMRKVRRVLIIVGIIVGVLVLSYGVLFALTGRSQLARVLVWRDADVGDINRFPSRVIKSSTASDLPVALDGSTAKAFKQIDPSSGGGLDSVLSAGGDLDTFLARTDTTAFLVIKDGVLVNEWYGNGAKRDTLLTSFSVSKSFLSTLIGIAVDQGHIGSLDDPITKYVPELLDRDPQFGSITLKNLITMSSGLVYKDQKTPWGDPAKTYYSPDLRATALSAVIEKAPGKSFLYNNYNPLLLGMALERATGQSVSSYMSKVLWAPLGAEANASWSLDSVGSGFEKMESGVSARAIDFARFGLMFANGGVVNGKQVVPSQWVRDATAVDKKGDPAENYQYFWWVYSTGMQGSKADFAAQGNLGQYIYVAPDEDTVIVRLGHSDDGVAWPWLMGTLAHQIGGPSSPSGAPIDPNPSLAP